MLRSAFRGKQPADSTAKEEKHASSERGKSHFFFHHTDHHEEDRKDQITNLNDDGIRYNASDGELYVDCNQEFLALEKSSSSSEKESRNEANGSGEKITSEESFVATSVPKNGGADTKDYRKESFSNSERQIYEMQLAQLQEQLVNTMIDHQELSK